MVVAPTAYLDGTTGGNFVLVASDAPLDAAAMESAIGERGAEEITIVGDDLDEWIGDADVLTDDFAPVDQLISQS
jgi:hypothetical protein